MDRRKSVLRRVTSAGAAILALAFLGVPPATAAAALPSPKMLTAYLDLECFRTNAYQPPPTTLMLRHINPVLANLPTEIVTLGLRDQLCVPVAKNDQQPPPPALDFIKFIDLACYRISGSNVGIGLVLSHLNPLFQNFPRTQVSMGGPQQLCVPVIKNNVVPPAEVLALVRHIDLKCYGVFPNTPMGAQISLRQLNPVLVPQIPNHPVRVGPARQLCVPVQKAGDVIPDQILGIIRWIDLEKFDLDVAATPQVTLTLRHINPVLAGLPQEQAILTGSGQLALPVAKNGALPPG
ncbi:hypothetical protein [Herbidospora sp. RD11066]